MKRKKILITGAVSILGKYLTRELAPTAQLVYLYHELAPQPQPDITQYHVDITDKTEIARTIDKIAPDVLIHLAGTSNIDYCESHECEAYTINLNGTQNICEAIKNSSTHLLFSSSNAVFDGTKPPYYEGDLVNPRNIYGKTKAAAEKIISQLIPNHTIIRFTTFFGWPPQHVRQNDLPYYLQRLTDESKIQLVNDRWFNPISVKFAAHAVSMIIDKKKLGTYHVAGKDRVTRFTWVKLIQSVFHTNRSCILEPVPSSFFPAIAPRPVDATLSIEKLTDQLGLTPSSLQTQLEDFKQSRD